MKVKLILPALLEATDPGFRPIKYALFPPLGLAALAGYLDADDEVTLEDEHVMSLKLDDEPDLVVMSVDITSARRAYEIADHYRRRGSHVALGGMTPYPGTALHDRVESEGRITDTDWEHYDTRHVVYRPLHMSPEDLLAGYDRAYRNFYAWGAIIRSARGQSTLHQVARHLTYAGGWKRFEPLWDAVIRSRRVSAMLPLLEATLDAFGRARRGARGEAASLPIPVAEVPDP